MLKKFMTWEENKFFRESGANFSLSRGKTGPGNVSAREQTSVGYLGGRTVMDKDPASQASTFLDQCGFCCIYLNAEMPIHKQPGDSRKSGYYASHAELCGHWGGHMRGDFTGLHIS